MIQSIKGAGTRDIFDGRNSKAAAKTLPAKLHSVARRKLDQLNQSISLNDLRAPPGNRLEALQGERAGHHSMRINDQFRVCFRWTENGPVDVEIVDYHG